MNTDKTYAEKIASEYAQKETSKVTALKKLDAKAKLPAEIFGYTVGIISALVLGIGMCLSMGILGDGGIGFMAGGIVVGLAGIAGISVNYPIYKRILAKSKKKYAADIIALAKEIADQD